MIFAKAIILKTKAEHMQVIFLGNLIFLFTLKSTDIKFLENGYQAFQISIFIILVLWCTVSFEVNITPNIFRSREFGEKSGFSGGLVKLMAFGGCLCVWLHNNVVLDYNLRIIVGSSFDHALTFFVIFIFIFN